MQGAADKVGLGLAALVGAQYDSDAGILVSGSAYVFVRSGTAWSEQDKLTASEKELWSVLKAAIDAEKNRGNVATESLGEQKEAVFAVTIPEEKGSFKRFCQSLNSRIITEFNYRYVGKEQADVFVGIKISGNAAIIP
mgnify:CR=1 FL=1